MPVRDLIASRLGLPVAEGNMNKSKVCRCLFGLPDHEELRRDLNNQLKTINADIKSTWNFDPVLDQPLNGRFEWTLASDAPAFYTKQYRPTKFLKRRSNVCQSESSSDSDESDNSSSPVLPVVQARLTASSDVEDERVEALELKRENETTPEARVVRQTRIPDFMRKRKRLSDEHIDSEPATKSLRL